MAERLNPLSLIGASADPTLSDRLTQSAKSTSDLQRSLAEIAQKNRAQLEAQKMAGEASRDVGMIGQKTLPEHMIKANPTAHSWLTNQLQSGLDLDEANITKAYGDAGVSAARMGQWPLPESMTTLGDLNRNLQLKRGMPLDTLRGVAQRPLTRVQTADRGGEETIVKRLDVGPGLTLEPKTIKTTRGREVTVTSKDDARNREIVDSVLDSLKNKRSSDGKTSALIEANIFHHTENPTGQYQIKRAKRVGNITEVEVFDRVNPQGPTWTYKLRGI